MKNQIVSKGSMGGKTQLDYVKRIQLWCPKGCWIPDYQVKKKWIDTTLPIYLTGIGAQYVLKPKVRIWIIEMLWRKSEDYQNIVLTIVSPGINLDLSGQSWLVKKGSLVYCLQQLYLPKDLVESSQWINHWISLRRQVI